MKKRILSYQINASLEGAEHLVNNKSFKLQAPTGAGKTMIIAQTIEEISKNLSFSTRKKAFIFVAPSTGALDHQGYEKITSYVNRKWVRGFKTKYIGTQGTKKKSGRYLENIDSFEENIVYFMGWALFGSNTNISKIDSEKNDIQKVIQNTKNNGVDIILIIDEAHREVKTNSDNKAAILESMDPFRVIELSATLDNPDFKVTVQDVRNEKAIKKNVVIDFGEPEDGDVDSPSEIAELITAAIKKQKEVREAYSNRGVEDNPLILIQIPDKSSIKVSKILGKKIDDYYLNEVQRVLDNNKFGKFVKGVNYAVWLSNEKTKKDKNELVRHDSPFEILIFKQAIATGWDIPRANILVRLREPSSPKFDIQTLGRILRNPRFTYYDNYLIDNAFVFTRDSKYNEKIKVESFVTSSIKKKVKLSRSGELSNFKINSIRHKSEVEQKTLISSVSNMLSEYKNELIKWLNKIEISKTNFVVASELDATKVLKGNAASAIAETTRQAKNIGQLGFNMNKVSNGETLFTIYIKYVAAFENKRIAFEAFSTFVNKELLNDFKKKEIFEKVASSDAKQAKKIFGDLNFFEWLETLKNSALKENSDKYLVPFELSKEMEYSDDLISDEWDQKNTYNISIKKWNWDTEKRFYSAFDNLSILEDTAESKNKPFVHMFRNGVNDKSYRIDYYDKNDKLSSFYPDFILINDLSKNIYIMETKDRTATNKNIDKKSSIKFNAISKEVGDIERGEYKVRVMFVEPMGDDFTIFEKDKENASLSTFIKELTRDILIKLTKP